MKRVTIKKWLTPRRKLVKSKTDAALDYHFKNPGITGYNDTREADCQICGRTLDRQDADPAHLFRRWHGKHEPEHILAAHRLCHTWMDARKERETWAQESGVNCKSGGIITWSLRLAIELEQWLQTGIDKFNRGNK